MTPLPNTPSAGAARASLSRRTRDRVKRLLYLGRQRHCSVCEKNVRLFKPFGETPRADALCPLCGSLERDRLSVWFLQRKTDLFAPGATRMLHVAPEEALVRLFKGAAGDGYLSADLSASHAMEQMDITEIPYPDATFDAIYCSHVLEHVIDDRRAMREFHRTLKPGGWAVLNVPITAAETFEDPKIVEPADRLRVFGQHDHVRRYGQDYPDRLTESGFRVARHAPGALLHPSEIQRFGLANGESGDLFFCTKHPPLGGIGEAGNPTGPTGV